MIDHMAHGEDIGEREGSHALGCMVGGVRLKYGCDDVEDLGDLVGW